MEKEFVQMSARKLGGGIVDLKYPPKKDTLVAKIFGYEITPIYFEPNGNPVFSREQYDLYLDMNTIESFNEKHGQMLVVEVTYDIEYLEEPSKDAFDTKEVVEEALDSLEDFLKLLSNRAKYAKHHKGERLNEFVVYGWYVLTWNGELKVIDPELKERVEIENVVEEKEIFSFHNNELEIWMGDNAFIVPNLGQKCLCCGKTCQGIHELGSNPWIAFDEKVFHEDCYKLLERNRQLAMVRGILLHAYKLEKLEILSVSEKKYKYKFLVKILGEKAEFFVSFGKNVIEINWNHCFEPVDFEKLDRSIIVDKKNKMSIKVKTKMAAVKCFDAVEAKRKFVNSNEDHD